MKNQIVLILCDKEPFLHGPIIIGFLYFGYRFIRIIVDDLSIYPKILSSAYTKRQAFWATAKALSIPFVV